MTGPQDVSGIMDQIHELKTQLADAEKRGALKALQMAAERSPGERFILGDLAARIESGGMPL